MIDLNNLKIPITVRENIEFRIKLHDWLAKDEAAQKDYIALLKLNPVLAYDSLFWTYDPRKPEGERNCPFIVSARPAQVKAIKIIQEVNWSNDIGINKSREEGATEILMKYLTLFFLFSPDISFIIGSRTEDLVDKTGEPSTLFSKIDYALNHLPNWLLKRLHIERTFKHIKNLDINSCIDGEATSVSFAAQKRATAVVLDEFGRVEPNIAQSIKDSVMDVSHCVIYNSTHFYGAGHAFAKVLVEKNIKIIILPWWENPEKNQELYHSENKTEWPSDLRSPWFDNEVPRRSRRDIMMNLWMSPTGASDQFFDPIVNNIIRSKFIKLPTFEGDIAFETVKKIPQMGKFVNSVIKRLKWWGNLKENKGTLRPDQTHNYIIGCDIGFGTGASNSTAEIVDRNTGKLVGEYVCADKSPEEFADLVTALSKWLGGYISPFIIWERTGGQGQNFGRRIIENGLTNVYSETTEHTKTRKRKQIYGWNNTGGVNGTKQDILTRLQIALKEGILDKPERKFIRVYSESVVNELDSYIFYESGEIDSGEMVDESSGARKRHGDRIIGLGLACLGLLDQPPAEKVLENNPPYGSLAWRMRQDKIEKERIKTGGWNEPKNRITTNWR